MRLQCDGLQVQVTVLNGLVDKFRQQYYSQGSIKKTDYTPDEERKRLHFGKLMMTSQRLISPLFGSTTVHCIADYINLKDYSSSRQQLGASRDASSDGSRPLSIDQRREINNWSICLLFLDPFTWMKSSWCKYDAVLWYSPTSSSAGIDRKVSCIQEIQLHRALLFEVKCLISHHDTTIEIDLLIEASLIATWVSNTVSVVLSLCFRPVSHV